MKILVQVSMILALLMTSLDSFSQFNKGRYIAGGSGRFSTSSNETAYSGATYGSTSNSFGFSPSVGYFVMDRLAVGATVSFSASRTKVPDMGAESGSTSATIGPFVRYYLPTPIFFQAAAMFGNATYKAYSPNESSYTNALTQLGLAVGYAWLLNDFVALEPMLGYQSFTSKHTESGDKGTDGSLYLSCAFTIYLGERK